MTVDEFVVAAAASAELPTLPQLAAVLADYLAALELAEVDYQDDPAVLVLGAFIAFHTHADINTHGGYKRLIQLCSDRIEANKDDDGLH